jgi:hypothetical protein
LRSGERLSGELWRASELKARRIRGLECSEDNRRTRLKFSFSTVVWEMNEGLEFEIFSNV